MKNEIIPHEQFHRAILKGKSRFITLMNKDTGNCFSYKIEWAQYDPYDHDSPVVPQFVSSVIGSGETAFMGCLYGEDYRHAENSIFAQDYPCVKIFKFVFYAILRGRKIPHIEIMDGLIMVEPEKVPSTLSTSPFAEYDAEQARLDREFKDLFIKRKKLSREEPVTVEQMNDLQYGFNNTGASLSTVNQLRTVRDFCGRKKDRYVVVKQLFKHL